VNSKQRKKGLEEFIERAPHCGPATVGRHDESDRQVWATEEGYRGDPLQRAFYRDAGFDVCASHIEKLLYAGTPGFSGLKSYRITGKPTAENLTVRISHTRTGGRAHSAFPQPMPARDRPACR
jgi:predicted glycosyl hydrolase (DUF1957 family)